MEKIKLGAIQLTGITLEGKTSNENGQSGIDCGTLWQEFETGNWAGKIPNKAGDEIFAVYHDYEGDHTKPYAYFIGCKINDHVATPAGMKNLTIPAAAYLKITAKGTMPGCVADAWRDIWNNPVERAYQADFEIYDEKSKDWSNAEVDIYLGIK